LSTRSAARSPSYGGIFDWDVAVRRLDELNARVEDPNLWNNAEDAQGVMRERQRLDSAIAAVRETERELEDNLGLIELGEAEGDASVVADAEGAIATLAREAARRQVETLLSGEADGNDATSKSTPALAGRKARTGPRCCSECTAAGPSARASRWRRSSS
jgi:peptide chain release factor 2